MTVFIRIYYISRVALGNNFLYVTSKVSIWSMIEPAIGICCMAASTYRPLFNTLAEKITTQSSNRTKDLVSNGSIPLHGNNFRLSRSMRGYLKSTDTKNSNSFDDALVMEAMESRAEGPRASRADDLVLQGGENKDGILYSTTVEISRRPRGDDMV